MGSEISEWSIGLTVRDEAKPFGLADFLRTMQRLAQPPVKEQPRGECYECKPHFEWTPFRLSYNRIAMGSQEATFAVSQWLVWRWLMQQQAKQVRQSIILNNQ